MATQIERGKVIHIDNVSGRPWFAYSQIKNKGYYLWYDISSDDQVVMRFGLVAGLVERTIGHNISRYIVNCESGFRRLLVDKQKCEYEKLQVGKNYALKKKELVATGYIPVAIDDFRTENRYEYYLRRRHNDIS